MSHRIKPVLDGKLQAHAVKTNNKLGGIVSIKTQRCVRGWQTGGTKHRGDVGLNSLQIRSRYV